MLKLLLSVILLGSLALNLLLYNITMEKLTETFKAHKSTFDCYINCGKFY